MRISNFGVAMSLAISGPLVRALGAAGMLVACSAAANAAVTARNCGNLVKTETVHSTDQQIGTSNLFAPVALSLVNFTTARPGCVLVSFSAQAFAPSGRLIWIRAVLDNAAVSFDGEVALVAESHNFGTAHSYSFLFPTVNAGAHNIHIQWRSHVNGQAVIIDKFGVEVRHR